MPTYAQRTRESRGNPAALAGEAFTRGIGSARKGYSDKIADFIRERYQNLDYFTHIERFQQRPLLNADYTPTAADDGNDGATEAELLLMSRGNKHIEVLGTSATSALCAHLEGGGVRLTTAGADADQTILAAQLDAGMSGLAAVNWDSRNEPLFLANIVAGPDAADVHNCTIFGGFKLTLTDIVATDANQFFFRVNNGAAAGTWNCVQSIADSDVEYDTGITIVAGTPYQLLVVLDENRVPHYYINGAKVWQGAGQATALATYEFYCGIADRGGGTAVELDVRNLAISQLYG